MYFFLDVVKVLNDIVVDSNKWIFWLIIEFFCVLEIFFVFCIYIINCRYLGIFSLDLINIVNLKK